MNKACLLKLRLMDFLNARRSLKIYFVVLFFQFLLFDCNFYVWPVSGRRARIGLLRGFRLLIVQLQVGHQVISIFVELG